MLRREAHHEARSAPVERRLERDVAVMALGDRLHDRRARARRSPNGRRARGRSARRPSPAARAGSPARRPRRRAPPRRCGARPWPRPRCPDRCGAARSPSGSARAGAARPARPRSRRRPAPRRRSRGRRRPARARTAAAATTSPRSTGRCGDLAAGVGAREQQQVGDQPAHPAARAQRGGGGLALLAVQRLLEQLEVGQHRRQRRAQLVRGVGDELALARPAWPRSRCAPRRARAASTPASWPARRPRRRPPGAGC